MRSLFGRQVSQAASNPCTQKRARAQQRITAAAMTAVTAEMLEPRRLLAAASPAGLPGPGAYTITVNDTADALDNPTTVTSATLGSNITLRDAINAADNTGGAATIVLAKTTYDFTTADNNWYGPNDLPPIDSNITIQGNGATLQRDSACAQTTGEAFRFFYVSGGIATELPLGTLTLKNLTLTNGLAKGGDSTLGGGGMGAGGAIFNQGNLTLNGVTLTGNAAMGGNTNDATGIFIATGGGIGQDASNEAAGGFGGSFPKGIYGGAGDDVGGGGFDAAAQEVDGGSGDTGGGLSGLGGWQAGQGFGGDGGSNEGNTGVAGDFGFGGQAGEGAGGVGGGGGGGFTDGGFGGGGSGGGGADVHYPPGTDDNTYEAGGFGGGGGGPGGGDGLHRKGLGGFGAGNSNPTAGEGGGGAGMGGAIFSMYGSVTVVNSTLAANTAQGGISAGDDRGGPGSGGSGFGGAIFNLDGTTSITFSTLAANTVTAGTGFTNGSADGGALFNLAYGSNYDTGLAVTAKATIGDSILAGCIPGTHDLVNQEVDGGYKVNFDEEQPINTGNTASITTSAPNIVVAYNNLSGGPNGTATLSTTGFVPGVTNANLGLAASLADNGGPTQTLALLSGSKAIDAGKAISSITTDQRGATRDSKPDIGSFEVVTSVVVTTTADEDNGTTDPKVGSGTSLREAMNFAQANHGSTTITFDLPKDSTITLSSELPELNARNVTITGPGSSDLTISCGSNATFGIFNLISDECSISGLTLTQSGQSAIVAAEGDLDVSNCTFNDDGDPSSGGAIHCHEQDLTLTSCTFKSNNAPQGGAVYMENGDAPTITGCDFEGNDAQSSAADPGEGGAIYLRNIGGNGAPISNCTFSSNSALADSVDGGLGGAMYLDNSSIQLSDCTVNENTAQGGTDSTQSNESGGGGAGIEMVDGSSLDVDSSSFGDDVDSAAANGTDGGSGGAIDSADSDLTITNSTLDNNRVFVGFGGAVCFGVQSATSATLTIINSTFSENAVNGSGQGNGGDASGGAIALVGSPQTVTINDSTIDDNSAFTSGGGIDNIFGQAAGPKTFHLANTIIANNTAGFDPDISADTDSGDYNLVQDPGESDLAGTHNITGKDPQLNDLASNGGPTETMLPMAGSPVINKGSNALAVDNQGHALTTDQRGAGFARISGGTVDIGAVEVPAAVVTKHPPITKNDTASTTPDKAVTVDVLANDSDPDGHGAKPTLFQIVSGPANGTASIVSGKIVYTPNTGFHATDSLVYRIKGASGLTATAKLTISVGSGVGVGKDPLDSTHTDLDIVGTGGNDNIQVKYDGSQGKVTVYFGSTNKGTFGFTGRILIDSGSGNDTITVDPKITRAAFIWGGAGNDTITGGGGNNMLLGGDGNDNIHGGAGRDMLFGGDGADVLSGKDGDDVLVPGKATQEGNFTALVAWNKEWSRTDKTYAQRVTDLTNGTGFAAGFPLNKKTVTSYPQPPDLMTGGTGQDLFYVNPNTIGGVGDKITDQVKTGPFSETAILLG